MIRRLPLLLFAFVVAASCGGKPAKDAAMLSKEPISVRGWISDVAGATSGDDRMRTVETESARKAALFQSTYLWVEGAPYVSGNIADNGSFVLFDVPPGNITVTFQAPGAPTAHLQLQNVPGNADVLVPALLLQPTSVQVLQPEGIRVRIAGRVDKPRPTGKNAVVAGRNVPIIETPIVQMTDRHDYPTQPGAVSAPVATVK